MIYVFMGMPPISGGFQIRFIYCGHPHFYKGRMTVTERYGCYSQTSYGVLFKSATS